MKTEGLQFGRIEKLRNKPEGKKRKGLLAGGRLVTGSAVSSQQQMVHRSQ